MKDIAGRRLFKPRSATTKHTNTEDTMGIIRFKCKIEDIQDISTLKFRECVRIPKIKHSHCDMDSFRRDNNKRLRSLSNSDLFLGAVARMLSKNDLRIGKWIPKDNPMIKVNENEFLATVTIDTDNLI